jgi:hypothetical protein
MENSAKQVTSDYPGDTPKKSYHTPTLTVLGPVQTVVRSINFDGSDHAGKSSGTAT